MGEELRRSFEETVMASIAAAGLDADGNPDVRLGAHHAMAQSQLEGMLAALPPLPVGQDGTADDLTIVGRLGEGGMGIVELARQGTLDREVALKRLREGPGEGSLASQARAFNLLDEARISGRLEHPNIVPVHAVGRDPELGPIVLFKRVQGRVWTDELLRDRDELPHESETLEKHLRVLLQVGNAVRYAHSRGVLHRDIKPDNVMLGEFGEVYLLDWGLAFHQEAPRLDAPSVAGTATYMAPEMATGDVAALGPHSDIYLLGATLHHLLTGQPRHRASSLTTCMMAAVLSEPFAYGPAIPSGLAAIANRACAREPADRFDGVEAFQHAIEDFLGQREALMLVATAQAEIEGAPEEVQRRSTMHDVQDQAEALARFQRARFAIEQALLLRPGLQAAVDARRELLIHMVRHALARDAVREAQVLAQELGSELPGPLRTELEERRERQSSRRKKLESLERDADVAVAQVERIKGIVAALLVITAAQAVGWWRHPGPGFDLSYTWLFAEAAVLSAGVLSVLAGLRRTLLSTRLNRQFLRVMLACATCVLMARTMGWAAELVPPLVLSLEIAIVSIIFIVAELPFRQAPFIGLAGVVAACVGAAHLDLARILHDGFLELIPVVALLDLLRERREVLARE